MMAKQTKAKGKPKTVKGSGHPGTRPKRKKKR